MIHDDLLGLKCTDFLKDNHRAYAQKARRKSIALICVEAINRDSTELRLVIGSSHLIAGGKSFSAEARPVILRKLSAFTWDFLVYLIIDFSPVTAVIEAILFLTGPIYNWRLRRHLMQLTDSDVRLRSGESAKAVLGFRGVASKVERLDLSVCNAGGQVKLVHCEIA